MIATGQRSIGLFRPYTNDCRYTVVGEVFRHTQYLVSPTDVKTILASFKRTSMVRGSSSTTTACCSCQQLAIWFTNQGIKPSTDRNNRARNSERI